LYVEDAVGAREHLAEVNLKRVRPEQEDDGDFLKVTERDMIPGTRVSLKKIGSTGTANCAFFLPKQSMIHWQRLWCFLDETSFAVASVDTLKTQSQPERRFKNLRGDFGDFLVATFFPGHEPLSLWMILTVLIPANIPYALYGGLHLLAWRYHFRSTAERILWKIAGVFTALSGVVPVSFGLIALLLSDVNSTTSVLSPTLDKFRDWIDVTFVSLILIWIIIVIFARMYLFVESFVALPTSPPSTYQIPNWTAYIPHI
jgi:hypothetical protein